MQESSEESGKGPIGSLLASLGNFAATLLTIGRTRIELLTVELQLEVRRIAELLVWAFVAIFATGVGLLMAGLAVILTFWDDHRVLAAVLVTGTFLGAAAVAALVLARKVREKPAMLEGTLAELGRDSEELRGRP